ncbi:MAG TPA: hypothetical protein VMW23_08790 [Sedimentisphaerales bacterium]|nr:hypothetical protein [Sedimentisphaerales bacterium]
MCEPIKIEDGNVIYSDDELYPIAKMSAAEIDKLADNLKMIALFFAKTARKNLILSKIAKVDRRLSAVERQYKIGDYETGLRKSIIAQDETEEPKKWPSLSQSQSTSL